MTERELLAVVSALVYEGSNDNAVDAVRRATHILRRVDETLNETLAAPPGTQPHVTPEPAAAPESPYHEYAKTSVPEHEEPHTKGKRTK